MDAFITDRLSEGSKLSIFDPIKKLKLASFHSSSKKKVIKTKTKTVALQFSRDLFSKVAIISQKRPVDLKQLFAYPLVHLPMSLAEEDGTLKNSAKSSLLHKLEGDVTASEMLRKDHTYIVDGMAFVKQIKATDQAYREDAMKLLKNILNAGRYATRIDVFFDVYAEKSIKDVERARRSSGEIFLKQIVATSPINQWNQLLSSGDFKNKLIDFLVDEWKANQPLVDGKILLSLHLELKHIK